MKSKRTKACEISPQVRKRVEERDSIDGVPRCIFCGRYGRGEAHYINRSQGGLGIEENIVTVCRECHRQMDNGLNTQIYREKAEKYLKSIYPNWNKSKLVFNKWK
jgi:5-methylcytosine-specific restriction endonuclease McrA